MTDLAEYLPLARQAAELGYHHMRTSAAGQVRAKGDRDLVTELDIRIEKDIRAYLADHSPGTGFLGEEDGGSSLDDDSGDVWVLDPIDGTSNYAHGLPLCAVSLALVRNGVPVIGVILAPFLELRYHAIQGGGAYVNDRPIHASTTSDLSRAIVSIGDYATGPDAPAKNARRYAITQALAENVERVRMFGSAALDLAWVAEGRTDACIMLSNKPWDTAAGVIIAREAGALVTNELADSHTVHSSATVAAPPQVTHMLTDILPAHLLDPRPQNLTAHPDSATSEC